MSKYTLETVPRDSQGWIKVTDLLPEEYFCIVWEGDKSYGAEYLGNNDWMLSGRYYSTDKVTHWQPLPGVPDEFKAQP